MDEFLTDEFFLSLIRLGVLMPEKRLEIREVLEELHKKREGLVSPADQVNKPFPDPDRMKS